MPKVQVGVRFDRDVWTGYKRLCQGAGVRTNELLESIMRRAVDSGDLKGVLATMGSGEAEEVVLTVRLRQDLDEIERLTDAGFWQAYEHKEGRADKFPRQELAEEIEALVENVLKTLPGCRDIGVVNRSKTVLGTANMYSMLERWCQTPGSEQARRFEQAYCSLQNGKQDAKPISE